MSLPRRPRHSSQARPILVSLFTRARHAVRRSKAWKASGTLVAAVLSLGLVATGASLAATAAGSDAPTPYTVTAQGVTLPAGKTFSAHGHVNYKATDLDGKQLTDFGVHFDPNNKQSGGHFIGESFFSFSDVPASSEYNAVTRSAASTFPDGYCITWVQVSGYDEHFGEGGQAPVCTAKKRDVHSVALYLYKKVDSSKPASWENSGKQTLIKTWDGKKYMTSYPGTLPSYVCGDGWGVQQDKITGKQSIFPEIVDRATNVGVLGWPPVTDAIHQELSELTDVPDCTTTITAPAAVTFSDVCGVNDDGVHIPALSDDAKFTYVQDDRRVDGVGTVTVTATPNSGFAFAEGVTTSWSHDFTAEDCPRVQVVVTDPIASSCDATQNDAPDTPSWIRVLLNDHVSYTISGDNGVTTVTSAYTEVPAGDYTVTATADEHYTLLDEHGQWQEDSHSWSVTVGDATLCDLDTFAPIPTAVTSTNEVCTDGSVSDGSITVGTVDGSNFFNVGVDYFIDGKKVTSQTTSVAAGTYTVTAVADPDGDATIEDGYDSSWSITIAAADDNCGELTTLAFTGANGNMAGMLLVALLLIIGGAGVFTASRVVRSRES